MGRLWATFLLLLLLTAASDAAPGEVRNARFTPGPYQAADGALVLQPEANYVEPYFATKALLVALDAGLDVREPALAWINWALPRQQRDGRLERFCRKPGQNWSACAPADADDSMLALWLQLLYRMAPDSGLPPGWQNSAAHAERSLDRLRNGRLGIYHVSRRNHVGLLMDNVEVYSALNDIARAQARFGDTQAATHTQQRAQDLQHAIQHVFWEEKYHAYRVSTQKREERAFYPDAVAQIYPLLSNLPTELPPAEVWHNWVSRFGADWLYRTRDPHPWGLLAVTALHVGDYSSARCWLTRAQSLRYSPRWNVLEEAAFQTLEFRLGGDGNGGAPCAEVLVSR